VQKSRNPKEGASPQTKLESVKLAMLSMKNFLRPITVEAHAPMDKMIALETR